MKYFVSRQMYYYSQKNVVEIVVGGRDYANPSMLVPKYTGEGEEYDDPIEAVENAILIRDSWVQDKGLCDGIAAGYTLGMTLEFEPFENDEAAKAWAKEAYEKLPKCDLCGKLLPYTFYTADLVTDERFCSEHCADRRVMEIFGEVNDI